MYGPYGSLRGGASNSPRTGHTGHSQRTRTPAGILRSGGPGHGTIAPRHGEYVAIPQDDHYYDDPHGRRMPRARLQGLSTHPSSRTSVSHRDIPVDYDGPRYDSDGRLIRSDSPLSRRSSIHRKEPWFTRWQDGEFTIMPEDNGIVDAWDVIVIIALFLTALLMPFEVAFLHTPPYPLWVTSKIIDCIFCTDIILTFNIAYAQNNGTAVTSMEMWEKRPAKIAANYMAFPFSENMSAGWFWPDIITVIPWEMAPMARGGEMQSVRLVRVLRLVRMLRLVRVIKLFKRLHTQSGFPFSMVRIFTCASCTLMLVHWLSCFWAHLGMHPDWYSSASEQSWLFQHFDKRGQSYEHATPFDVYRSALYLCTVVLTTVGFGDITPTNDVETLTMVITIFLTGITWAWVVANVVNVITSVDKFGSTFNQTMDDINSLMSGQDVSRSLTYRIRRHLHESYHVQRRLHHRDALHWLSDGLKGEFAIESGVDRVCECIWYFKDLAHPVLIDLADKFKGKLFSPNELIMDQNSVMVVVRGTCIRKAKMITRNCVFGEDMILVSDNLRDTSCPRTISYVEVMSLHRDDLRRTCLKFPSFDARIRKAQAKLAVWRAFVQQAAIIRRAKERTGDKKSMWDRAYFENNLTEDITSRQRRNSLVGSSRSAPNTPTAPKGAMASASQTAKSVAKQVQERTKALKLWSSSEGLHSGSRGEQHAEVIAEIRKLQNLLMQVQSDSTNRWRALESRFALVENKVMGVSKHVPSIRKFWG